MGNDPKSIKIIEAELLRRSAQQSTVSHPKKAGFAHHRITLELLNDLQRQSTDNQLSYILKGLTIPLEEIISTMESGQAFQIEDVESLSIQMADLSQENKQNRAYKLEQHIIKLEQHIVELLADLQSLIVYLQQMLKRRPDQSKTPMLSHQNSGLTSIISDHPTHSPTPNSEEVQAQSMNQPVRSRTKSLSGRESSVLALLARIQDRPDVVKRKFLEDAKLNGYALCIGEVLAGNKANASKDEIAAAEGFLEWAKELNNNRPLTRKEI